DRLDLLAADDDAASELVEQMRAYRLDLQDIPEHSPLLRAFDYSPCSVCPVLDLARPVPGKLAKNLRQARRVMGEHELFSDDSPEHLPALFELHKRQWQERGETGVLDNTQLVDFHLRASAGFSRAGMLRLHVLKVGARTAGVLYGFARNGRMHYYLSGYDPQLERFSPGSLLIEHAIEHARAAGDRDFDFLRGSEPYKYRWGAVDRPQFRISS
ncbi:MAG TPA: GNAT family N-acetyltransferase, partial [Bryobacteraceae bacterium]|nr:GNAT family N-acetyltransferase [Bryobacteraceae bacterium]